MFAVHTSKVFTELFFPLQKLDIIYQSDFLQVRRIWTYSELNQIADDFFKNHPKQ
jgi:hypothetical protein